MPDDSSYPPHTQAPLAPQVEFGRRLPGTSKLTERERIALLAQYLAGQRARPQIRNAPPASRAMTRIIKPLAKTFGPGSGGLERQWDQIAGPKLSRLSKPSRITGGRDGRVLTVIARGPAAALISADSQNILARINTYLGAGTIARLKIVQGAIATQNAARPVYKPKAIPQGLTPDETSALQKGLENVRSERLKQALERLGRAVIASDKSGKRL
ncbi:DUF721 domain-containing protein [Robiginitomaculum antarcticum]|uniref:DUF721 domain-containing protein n=1 Tax=Robiginitomaculum antarcticum TaxID=437507 RepID=UPI00035D08A4|nr:DciA family protein [Robiginitomaculum antarcticum]